MRAPSRWNVFLILLIILLFMHFGLRRYLVQEESPLWEESNIHVKDPRISDGLSSVSCTLNSFAKSAVSRASSPSCKTRLSEVACQFQKNELPYDISIKSNCLARRLLSVACGTARDTSCGCFPVNSVQSQLPQAMTEFQHGNSPATCIDYCHNERYPYAGLFAKFRCICFFNLTVTNKVDASLCSRNCPGAFDEKCGSEDFMNVHWTNTTQYPIVHKTSDWNDGFMEDFEENDQVRIVFFLILNGRNIRQVLRLFKAIYHVNHYYYIHVDVRARYMFESIVYLQKKFHNVRFMTQRFPAIWGGTSLLHLVLAALRDLLSFQDWHWDFIINLSESDFPIRPDRELRAYLTHFKDRIFLASHRGNATDFVSRQGMDKLFYECDQHLYLLGNRSLFSDIFYNGGGDWMILPKRFVQFVVDGGENIVSNLIAYFNYSLLPVESFFHTVAQNSHFCDSVSSHNLRYVNWKRPSGCLCQQLHVVDWCGCSPNVIKMTELSSILDFNTQGSAVFFARKFDPTVDQQVINAVSNAIFPQQKKSSSSSVFWESVLHSEYDDVSDFSLTFAMALLSMSTQAVTSHTCKQLEFANLTEITNIYVNDAFHGPVLTFSLRSSDQVVEFKYKKASSSSVSVSTDVVSLASRRLLEFEVGLNFDVKEGIFRDRLSVLNPFSKPQLSHAWLSGEPITVSFLFLDPLGRLASALEVSVPQAASHDVSLPHFHGPLLPGVWKVVLLDEDFQMISHAEFLVIPTLYYAKAFIEHSEMYADINAFDKQVHPDESNKVYKDLIGKIPAVFLDKLVSTNVEYELQRCCSLDQVAALLKRLYTPELGCKYETTISVCSLNLDNCHDVLWSTQSKDPKSYLPAMNTITGYLH